MDRVRVWLLRRALRVAHSTLRVYWFVARPSHDGVKCVVARGDEVLLVRHSYGDRDRWELPGGSVKRGERPAAAARREAREELGFDPDDWAFLGTLFERIEHKDDTLWCFRAPVGDAALTIDRVEIAEARWFPCGGLPTGAAPSVARALALDR